MPTMSCPACSNVIDAVPGTTARCPRCGFTGQVPHGAYSQPSPPSTPWPAAGGQSPYGWQPPVRAPPSEGVGLAALLLNILVLPGLGTIIGGRTSEGVTQLVLTLVGMVLLLIVIGILVLIGVWVWALVSGIQILQEAQAAKRAGWT